MKIEFAKYFGAKLIEHNILFIAFEKNMLLWKKEKFKG